MILLYVKRAALIVAVAAATYLLAAELGPWPAAIAGAAAAAVACTTGAALLRTSAVGRVTWRNRLASYLIPWGWRLNRGRLWPVVVTSWAVWTAVGVAAVLLRPTGPTEPVPVGTRVALFAAWAVDGAAMVYLLGTVAQATPGSRVGGLWKMVAVATGVIGVSVGLYLTGLATVALVAGSGPPLAVGGGIGLFVLFFATAGRNTRWN